MYKSKKVKMLCVVVAVLSSFSMAFTGCGSTTNNEQAQSSVGASVTTASSESKLEYAELTWYIGTPTPNMSNEEKVMAEVNKILKEKINANLKFYFVDNSKYAEKLNIMTASEEAFDLAEVGWYLNNFSMTMAKGGFIPVDELLQKYGQTILKQVPEKLWSAVTFNGKRMGILDLTAYAQPRGLSFKKDLVEKYKFDYATVKTMKDIEPFLENIKKNENGITPFLASTATSASSASVFLQSAYDSITSSIVYDFSDNKVKSIIDCPAAQEVFKTSYDWYKKGYIAKDAALKNDVFKELKSGKYAVMNDSGVSDETGAKSTAFNGYPCVEKTLSITPLTTQGVQSPVTGISKTSKNPERAMMLKDLMASDTKLFNTMCYGLEGQDYKVVSGAGTDNPTIEANGGDAMHWAIWHPWIGNLFLGWPSNWNSQAAIDNFKKYNDSAMVSPLLGFTFNSESVKTEVAKVDSIIVPSLSILSTGSEPDYDKYYADIKSKSDSAGMQKVIDEINKQISEWQKNNGK